VDELEEGRRQLEETERERDELRQELEAIRESHQEPAEAPETLRPYRRGSGGHGASGGAQGVA
jgi:prefoldin subunit 5